MIPVTANGRMLAFHERPESTDWLVIRETFGENTYGLTTMDFAHSGIMLDIGANIGSVSLLAFALGAKQVVAYEPEPGNRAALERNLQVNNVHMVTVQPEALWSMAMTLPLVPSFGGSTSEPEAVALHAEQVIQVPAIPLIQALEAFPEVDVVKCDAEGAEYEIFHCAAVNAKARKIVMEFHKTTKERFGALVATLVETHNVHAFGHYERGGQITALRY